MKNLTDNQKTFMTANGYLNAGLVGEKSTLCLFLPEFLKLCLAKGKIAEAEKALDYILPENAYEKPHDSLDEVVVICYDVIKAAKSQTFQTEQSIQKTK